ncbi:MAG TPA: hypothetical protein VHY37_11675, partial [Tepidisphaeraceae bacterium]|nr:hypothetical protein [Tepidisphaeraceae bacterium]
DAARGDATAIDARGAVTADSARGNYTVQVVRGNVQALSGRNENSSAVVRPDLAVTIKADPPAAAPGDTVVYTITIKNISSIAARGLTITDYLPQQLQVLSARGASIETDPDDSSTHLTIPDTLAPGAWTIVQLQTRVKPARGRP